MSPVLTTACTAALVLVAHRLVTRDLVRGRLRRDLASSGSGDPVASRATRAVVARVLSRRRRRQRHDQLAPALDTVASSLRAGRSMTDAIADAACVGVPLGPELAAISEATRRGAPLTEALDHWAADADGDTRAVAAALAVGASVGGPIARAVDGAAQSLRERQALQQEASALATQARTSAVVLSLAPVVVVGLLAIADPGMLRAFAGTRIGQGCLVAGLALDAAGALWMRHMVHVAVDPPRVAAGT